MVRFVAGTAFAILFTAAAPTKLLASSISGKILILKDVGRAVAVTYDLRGAPVSGGARKNSNNFDRVAIWLESETPEPSTAAPPPLIATMQQRNRQLEPELLVLPQGSTVNFPNLDPIFHNIFSLSKAQSFDLGYYPKGSSRSVTFPRTGIVQVYCHVHPNMSGAIVITSSRWSGKPGPDGAFLWNGVPPGKYRLMIWQRFAGLFRRDVVVPASGEVAVQAAIPEQREER